MNPVAVFLLLIASALSAYVLRTERAIRISAVVFGTLASFALGLTAIDAFSSGLVFGPRDMWYVGEQGGMLLLVITVVFLLSVMVSYRSIGAEHQRGILSLSDVRLYYFLLPLFLLSLTASLLANSIIVLWIAMEMGTLVTAFLVGIYRRKSSLEAAWKYVLLCSMGIGLSLTGLVLAAFAFKAVGLPGGETFLWTSLSSVAGDPRVNTALLKLSFVFLVVGFATKMGLVPIHAWLPDALSKTPAPVAALLAGALLPVTFLTLLRFKHIADTALQGSGWTEGFFLAFGLLSIVLPSLLLLIQENYKRVLAYATIVHMGVMMFAVGLGPWGMTPALMHLPVFSLLISAGFFLSGEVILRARSTNIEILRGLWRRMPHTSALLFAVLILTLFAPPGGMFMSELLLIGYGLKVHAFLTLIAIGSALLFSSAIMRLAFTMFFGEDERESLTGEGERLSLVHGVALFEISCAVLLGAAYLLPQTLAFFSALARPLITVL